ncbi:MAG TPA: ferredoxin family protein [Longimicrobium sp.]|nr:ferredoxin family protein [Longimicrobium sp.]
MPYVVTQPCFGCKYGDCIEVCPVDCIYLADEIAFIHPDECIDCGACDMECPVQAIYPDTDVPQYWQGFITLNAELALAKDRAERHD